MHTIDYDIRVSLAHVTDDGYKIVALFDSVINANSYAKALSTENPDRLVAVTIDDDEYRGYRKVYLNGARQHNKEI